MRGEEQMRTRRTNKVLTMSVLCVSVLALAIGFAAFSNTLTISSGASVTPNASTFNVDFSTSSSSVVAGSVVPTKSPTTISATNGTIDNSAAPTLTGLSAEFTEPGQIVMYKLYAYNAGEYLAYLNGIVFNGEKKCTPGTGTTASYVTEACEGISISVKVGSDEAVTSTTTGISNHTLAVGSGEVVTITLQYGPLASLADGPFTVELPEVSLVYSTVANYEVPEESTSNIVYRWSTDEIAIGDTIDPSTYTTDPSTLNKNVYLKHVLDDDNKVIESYACAVFNNEETCLMGGSYGYADDPVNYTGDVLTLKGLQAKGLSCDFSEMESSCGDGNYVSMNLDSDGWVNVNESNYRCHVHGNSSFCGE